MISILDALECGARELPERPVWTFLNDNGDPTDSYTYKVCIPNHLGVEPCHYTLSM
jgi:hypothetical protein